MIATASDTVNIRLLNPSERRVPTKEAGTPVVIEPLHSARSRFLCEFLNTHSETIHELIARHGAVLIRGFELQNQGDFEEAILSVKGMYGIDEALMSERGRTRVDGTRFVLHTNTLYKTGGTLDFGTFHSENYFTADVPRFISFYCQRAGWLGGETGLVNTVKLFDSLPEALKRALEERSCFVAAYSLEEITTRYGLPSQATEAFFSEIGMRVVEVDGTKFLALHKPNVFLHPHTNERVLQTNFNSFQSLNQFLVKEFLPDYVGPQWLLHRLVWRFPQLARALGVGPNRRIALHLLFSRPSRIVENPALTQLEIGHRFSNQDLKLLAANMRRFYSSFCWKRGDVLLIDNFRMAHSGMAGYGKRELRAMICNPVHVYCPKNAVGLQVLDEPIHYRESIGAQLSSLRCAQNGRRPA